MSSVNPCYQEHEELATPVEILEKIRELNQEEVLEAQKQNEAELKAFSDELREIIRTDMTRPIMNFYGYNDNHKKVTLSLPNDASSKYLNDVTMEIYMKDREFAFEIELRFSEYMDNDEKAIKYVGSFTKLVLEDCDKPLSQVLYELYKDYIQEFAKLSSKDSYDSLLEYWTNKMLDDNTYNDLSEKVLNGTKGA